MRKPAHIIDIDRIILTDLGVISERAERIRTLVEIELQRLLARDGMTAGLAAFDIPYVQAPAVPLPGHNNDQHLANGLVRSIAQGLHGVG